MKVALFLGENNPEVAKIHLRVGICEVCGYIHAVFPLFMLTENYMQHMLT